MAIMKNGAFLNHLYDGHYEKWSFFTNKLLECNVSFIWNIEKIGQKDGLKNIYLLYEKPLITDMIVKLKI